MGKRRSGGRVARKPKHGKHRRGKQDGSKPAPAFKFQSIRDGRTPVTKAEARQFHRLGDAMKVAAYALQLAMDLPVKDGGGDPVNLVNRAAMKLELDTDALKDQARDIVREQLKLRRAAVEEMAE